jgi:Xaa-Pro dipeptidase
LRAGDLLTNEIEAKWGGYIAQVVAPAFIGAVPAQHLSTYETSMKIFQALCPRMRPGASLASLSKDYQTMARDTGYKPAAWLFHGRGLGDDLPAMPTPTVESEEKLEEGNVLILKPGLVPMNGRDEGSVRVGETVVVTKNGARRLGKRQLEVIEIPTF